MGFYSSRVNPAIVSRQEQRAFIPIYCKLGYVPYNAACAEALQFRLPQALTGL